MFKPERLGQRRNHKITVLWLAAILLLPASSWGQRPEARLSAHLADTSKAESFADRFEEQVWLTDMSDRMKKFVKTPEQRIKLLQLIHQEAIRANLPPELVLALIQTESSFNRFAVSSAGAQGLMQVMPFWKDVMGRPMDNLTDVATNLRYGCTILSYYLEKEKGNMTRALARYNGSLGKTWYPKRVFANLEQHWKND
ncbi:MAG: lytic transglycosylase domain-containing protein [Endozoicomonas sp.]